MRHLSLRKPALALCGSIGLWACGTLVFDHTPRSEAPDPDSGNLVDLDTSKLVNSIGYWNPWYATTVWRDTDAGWESSASLGVQIAGNSWGVGASNWPGYAAAPGPHWTRFWARAPIATDLSPSLVLTWNDSGGNQLKQDTLNIPWLTPEWQPAAQALEAPAGTATVAVAVIGTTGSPQEVLEVDDLFIGTQ
jgi:hypothetical protein